MQKKIYLTIDDSPSAEFRSNLEYLISKNIPAVFFCIGNQMEDYWEDIKFAIQHGYPIGNHSYTHPHFSDIDIESAKTEINLTDKLIQKAYNECGIEDYDRYFRFPYGDKGDGKYGYQFLDFETANTKNRGRIDLWMTKLSLLHPLHRFVDGKKEEQGQEQAQLIQQHLFRLGYVRGDLRGVKYDFFHPLKTDQDWSWTFDIAEWKWDKKTKAQDFLDTIFHRLDEHKPKDMRGDFEENPGLQNFQNTDIVLFHDRSETNRFFKPIIDYMIAKKVEFLPVDLEYVKVKPL